MTFILKSNLPSSFFLLFKSLSLFSSKNYNTNVTIKNIQNFFIQQTQNKKVKIKN